MEQNFIEDQLIILTKSILDKFYKENNPDALNALYVFYYYTAKWQKTNQPKATTEYAARGLKWSLSKTRSVKKQLISMGLIEDVKVKDDGGKIKGWYIKINYILKSSSEQEIKTTLSQNHRVETEQKPIESTLSNSHRVEVLQTNALSTSNINALSTSNISADADSLLPLQKSEQNTKQIKPSKRECDVEAAADLELYHQIEDAFKSKTQWTHFAKEGKAIKWIIDKCKSMNADDPGKFAASMINILWTMCEKDKFYRERGFLPSTLNAAFDQVLIKAKSIIEQQRIDDEAMRIHNEVMNEC